MADYRVVENEEGFFEVWRGNHRATELEFVNETMAKGWIKQQSEYMLKEREK